MNEKTKVQTSLSLKPTFHVSLNMPPLHSLIEITPSQVGGNEEAYTRNRTSDRMAPIVQLPYLPTTCVSSLKFLLNVYFRKFPCLPSQQLDSLPHGKANLLAQWNKAFGQMLVVFA